LVNTAAAMKNPVMVAHELVLKNFVETENSRKI